MSSDEKKSVLIVDDDITVRKLISHHLKRNDYSVIEAEGSTQAFEELKKGDIDLVLCDVTMEEMDGFTVRFCDS